jgi:sorting nexin-29
MELIKYADPLLHWRLLHIINQCWLTCKVPESWKIAEVISLFKKGDCRECKNYRGLSLLNTLYKIYARIVNKRLRTISEALLQEEQNGFRNGRSTTDNIFILKVFEK